MRNSPSSPRGVEHTLDARDAESPDQLVLEVGDAHVEAQSLHVRPGEVGAEARPLDGSPEVALLTLVAEPRDPEPEALRAEPAKSVPDRLGAADRHDLDVLGGEVASPALGQGLERALVADPSTSTTVLGMGSVPALFEVLLEAEVRDEEDGDQRRDPDDHGRREPRAGPRDREAVGDEIGDDQGSERRDQGDAAEDPDPAFRSREARNGCSSAVTTVKMITATMNDPASTSMSSSTAADTSRPIALPARAIPVLTIQRITVRP